MHDSIAIQVVTECYMCKSATALVYYYQKASTTNYGLIDLWFAVEN